jgi:hypothetical protein
MRALHSAILALTLNSDGNSEIGTGAILRIPRTAFGSSSRSLLRRCLWLGHDAAPGRPLLGAVPLLLGHEPKVEVRRALHQRQEIDSVGSSGKLDRWHESFQDRTELGTLIRSHLAEIQEMPSGFDDNCSRIGHLYRGVLYEEVLAFDKVALRRRTFFTALALLPPADEAVRLVVIRRRTCLVVGLILCP